jgi:hypothetical protein
MAFTLFFSDCQLPNIVEGDLLHHAVFGRFSQHFCHFWRNRPAKFALAGKSRSIPLFPAVLCVIAAWRKVRSVERRKSQNEQMRAAAPSKPDLTANGSIKPQLRCSLESDTAWTLSLTQQAESSLLATVTLKLKRFGIEMRPHRFGAN